MIIIPKLLLFSEQGQMIYNVSNDAQIDKLLFDNNILFTTEINEGMNSCKGRLFPFKKIIETTQDPSTLGEALKSNVHELVFNEDRVTSLFAY